MVPRSSTLNLKLYYLSFQLTLAQPYSVFGFSAAGGLGRTAFTRPFFDSLAIFVIMFDVKPLLQQLRNNRLCAVVGLTGREA